MWRSSPFLIPVSFAVEVRNLSTARSWYQERLGLRETGIRREDDSGLPFVDLHTGKVGECITLIEAEPGATVSDLRPILFTKNAPAKK